MSRPHASLGDLVELTVRLRQDAAADPAQLHERDRRIGMSRNAPRRGNEVRILFWLAHRNENKPVDHARRAVAVHRLVRLGLLVLGVVFGSAAAGGVFYYDGTYPVNIIYVLAAFVGLQWMLLTLLALAALPSGLQRWIPGLRSIQESIGVLSPGQWVAVLKRWLPQRYRETFLDASGTARAHQAQFGRVQKWAALEAAQVFAVGFYTTVLAVFLSLVFFKDMAFGWSTTLQVDARDMQKITQTLATPWAWAWPQASPSPQVIEQSRYYRWKSMAPRLDAQGKPIDPAVYGAWWPFIVACLVTYGLTPRLVTLAVARWRFRNAVREAFVHAPGVRGLLQRLEHPLIHTHGESSEENAQCHESSSTVPTCAGVPIVNPANTIVIHWAGASGDETTALRGTGESFGVMEDAAFSAGGSQTPEEDEKTIEVAAGMRDAEAVIVVVKAWEPPMREFEDFLRQLRAAVGDKRPIEVIPVATDRGQPLSTPADVDMLQWRRAMDAMGDPWLSVVLPRNERS